jgi:hypothetical protein
MRAVTVETVFNNICMFIQEWPSFLRMALNTGFFDTILEKIHFLEASMGVVTINTEYPAFFERMMTRQGKLGLGGLMAAKTELAGSKRRYF